MAKKKEVQPVQIKPINIQMFDLAIVGDAGLISHAWSEKAKKEMLAKQMKKAKQGKKAKDPEQDYRESLYWLDRNSERIPAKKTDPAKHKYFGFPSIAFKAAAVRAANDCGLAMTETRRAFHVLGEFVLIQFDSVRPREDMVRLNGGVADIRYRGEFLGWKAVLRISHNANVFSAEQIVNLFNTAGFGVGIGEWRPEKNGASGTFHVELG